MTFQNKASWINEKFKLNPRVGQDWHIENADSTKLDLFVDFYLETEDLQEKALMFNLIIASLNELDDSKIVNNHWSKIKKKVLQNFNLHIDELIYWSRIIDYNEDKEDSIFVNSEFLTEWIDNVTKESTLRVESENCLELLIDGQTVSEIINRKAIPFKIEQILEYLKNDIEPLSDEGLTYSSNVDYFYLKKKKHIDFTFLEIKVKDKNTILLKFRNGNLEKVGSIKKYTKK